MGSIFRQQYYVTVRGKRVKRESKKWYIQYRLANGEFRREAAYADKQASMHKLTRREKEIAFECEGVFDHLTKELGKPIAEHLADYVQHLKDKRNTALHCQATQTRIERVCKFGEIKTAPQITKARVDAGLAKLRDKAYWPRPISTATSNHYLTAVKGFAQWLVDERRAADNLIAAMRKRRVEGERVKERRPLSPAEFAKLMAATEKGPERLNLSGPDRVALYVLASFTGYRRRELSSVTPSSFTFGDDPRLAVVRGYSKRSRVESIPINRDVAAFFKGYVAGRQADKPLWPIAKAHTATMIQADMTAAGIAFRKGIEVVDFHSLRQGFTTALARAGVAPKVTQQLSRHSDVNLTMGVYAKMSDADERAAVESLPVPEHLTQNLTQRRATHGTKRRSHGPHDEAHKLGKSRKKIAKRRR